MMETYIAYFCTIFYILAIQKLAAHLPHAHIIGTNHCGNTRREEFERGRANQDVFCCCDYSERVLAIFYTKYNMNTMAAIDLFILKSFH